MEEFNKLVKRDERFISLGEKYENKDDVEYREKLKIILKDIFSKYASSQINFSKLYGKTIGKHNLRFHKGTFQTMKKYIRDYVMDHCHHHKWIYFTHFDDMIEKFQEFEYKENISGINDPDYCWEIFTIRYLTNNWNKLNPSDYTEGEIKEMNTFMENYPNEDPWNSGVFTGYALLRNRIDFHYYYCLLDALGDARFDDILNSRDENTWRIIYQCRDKMIPRDNLWFNRVEFYQDQSENLFYFKFRDNSELELEHGLKKDRPKEDIPLEYFPRERSRPQNAYAYVQYWIDNGMLKNDPGILSIREYIDKDLKEREEKYNKIREHIKQQANDQEAIEQGNESNCIIS